MIKVIAGGKKSVKWVEAGCAEYEKRLRKPFATDWQFCDEDRLLEKVLKLPKEAFVILLDENGRLLDSLELAMKIKTPLETGHEVVFVIGGAFGHFPEELKQRADLILSLSKLVYPHQICRLVLAEQIYRSQEICLGHPYHHA